MGMLTAPTGVAARIRRLMNGKCIEQSINISVPFLSSLGQVSASNFTGGKSSLKKKKIQPTSTLSFTEGETEAWRGDETSKAIQPINASLQKEPRFCLSPARVAF